MKFIGQHIFDSVAKFRGNYGSGNLGRSGPAVEIQGDDSSFITLATNTVSGTPGAWLELDSGSNDGPHLDITNRDTDANPSYLNFSKRGDEAIANDKIGQIQFRAYHTGAQSTYGDDFTQGLSGLYTYAAIVGEVSNPASGTSYGKLHLGVRAAGGQATDTTVISGVATHSNKVNVSIANGSTSVTTIAGDLTISGSDFTFDSVALTGIQTSGESFSDDDVSLMTSAAIDDRINTAVATTVGGSVDLTSEVSGVLPVANGGTGASSLTDNKLLTGTGTSAVVAEANATYDGTDLTLTSGTSAKPVLTLENSNTDAVGSILKFEKTATGTAQDKIGKIQFQADDDADQSILFGEIEGSIYSAASGSSAQTGQLELSVRQAGSLAKILKGYTLGYGTQLEFGDGGILAMATFNCGLVNFGSGVSTLPFFSLTNSANDATCGSFVFVKDRATDPGTLDGDKIGQFTFRGFDSGNAATDYSQITATAVETDASNESGKIEITVMSDGQSTQRNAVTATGHTTVDKVDIDLGYGAASTTTVAGDLSVTTGLILDSVDVTTIQTSAESFADNDTSLMTSAAIDDRINAAGSGVSVSDSTANTDFPVVFHDESNNLHDDTGAFTYNPSTTILNFGKGITGQFQATQVELGHASDTTIARSAAGRVTIEGEEIVTTRTPALTSAAAGIPCAVMQTRRTITTAEANSMHSAPIEIVPAQGANTVIIPLGGMIRIDRAATQNASAADWNMHYAGKEPGAVNSTSLHHIRRFMYGETGDRVFHITPGLYYTEVSQDLTTDVNAALEVSFDSATTTDCFTSIEVYLTYQVISIA